VHTVGQLSAPEAAAKAQLQSKSDAIQRDEGAANALQHGEEKRRPIDEP